MALHPLLLLACSARISPVEEPAFEWVVDGGELPGGQDSQPPGDPPVEEQVEEPSPYEYPGEAPDPVGAYDSALVAGALQEAIDALFDYRGRPGVDAYRLAMYAARSSCPMTYGDSSSTMFWMDTCSTPEGAEFSGYSTYSEYDDYLLGNTLWDGDVLWGNASIETAMGYRFDGGGTLYDLHGYGAVSGYDTESWYSVISGVYSWTGPGSEGTWLEEAVTPAVRILFTRYLDQDARRVEVDGSIPLHESAIGSATFSGVVYADERIGWECESEPSGQVSLRGADGYWYDVAFHGGQEEVEDALCDGCGTVSFRGEVLGQACVDWGSWVGWGTAPW